MLVLLLVLGAAAAQTVSDGQAILCGKELAKAHSMFCYGIKPVPDDSIELNALLPLPDATDDRHVDNVPKIPSRFKFASQRKHTTGDLQLEADLMRACCHQPCLLSELLNHC